MALGDIYLLRQELRDASAILRAHDMKADLWVNEVQTLISAALAHSFRTSSGRPRAPREARPITEKIATRVLVTLDSHPTWSQQKVANLYNLGSAGRVHEIITGKWREARAQYEKVKDFT